MQFVACAIAIAMIIFFGWNTKCFSLIIYLFKTTTKYLYKEIVLVHIKGNWWNTNRRLNTLLVIVSKKKFANCTPLNLKYIFITFMSSLFNLMLSMVGLNCLINFCPFFGSTTYMTTKTLVRDQKQKHLWISHL